MPTLRDLMTEDPVTLEPEMSLRDAIERLTSEGISGVPVVSGQRLVGVVSATDILEFHSSNPGVPSYREKAQEWGQWGPTDAWEEDVTEPPAGYFREMWTELGADVVERMSESAGARLMVERQVHRLIVAEDHTLMGIVSTMDFVRAVAEGRLRSPE